MDARMIEAETVFRRLAERLDIDALEDELAGQLRRSFPHVTVVVRIGTQERPSRIVGPNAARARAASGGPSGILACPIVSGTAGVGFLAYVDDEALAPVRDTAAGRLTALASLAAVPAVNALRHDEALRLAYKDALTGLFNRRAFVDHLDRESQRASRHARDLALVMLDLDGLKRINDTFGHQAGDDALKELGAVLLRVLRRPDIVARLGGDEFAILCPDTGAEAARRVAGRICRALSERRAGAGGLSIALGVSCGVTDLAEAGGQASRMLELADAELYRVKRARQGIDGTQITAPQQVVAR